MKKGIIVTLVILSLVISGYYFLSADTNTVEDLVTVVKKGEFQIDVATTGELEAKSSIKIMGPTGLNRANIWQSKIEHLIDEGTVVKKGDYIGRLDKSEILDKITAAANDLQLSLSQYTQTKMDTALDLRKSRDETINLEFDVEEKQIIVSQSLYEPEAVKRQNEIEEAKAARKFQQAKENYLLQKQKAVAQMNEANAKVSDNRQKLEFLQGLQDQFTITAPEPGMLIYKRDWRGQKLGVGASIQNWDPVVATLPDLTKMVSKTYVNEVDIRIIKVGQKVEIGLDAFPEKKLTGKVIEVANIGEQKPNADSKVFQVLVEVIESDTTLRPAMTTSNRIIAEVLSSEIFVPLEAVHSLGDSISYVFMQDGGRIIRKEVTLGKSNSNEIVILEGLEEREEILLSIPMDDDKQTLVTLKN